MGPGVRGNPGDRSDPRRGGRREPVRAAGRCSEGEPKSGSMVRWQQCRLICDAVRKTSKVAPNGASRVGGKAREDAGKAKRPATQRSVERALKSNLRQRSQARFR